MSTKEKTFSLLSLIIVGAVCFFIGILANRFTMQKMRQRATDKNPNILNQPMGAGMRMEQGKRQGERRLKE